MTNYSLLISCPITSSRRTFLPPQGTLHHQIHGVLEVSGDLWTWSSPTPLLKARLTTAACSGPCPVRLWASPKMQVPQWFWAAWSCSVTLPHKKINLMFKWKLLYFKQCPWSLVLSLGTREKSLSPSHSFQSGFTHSAPHPWASSSQG